MALSKLLGMAHPENPKEHSIPDLMDSILRFGFTAPPTVDDATGVLVAGHGRIEALETLRAAGRPPAKSYDGPWPPLGIKLKGDEWMVPVLRGVSFTSPEERDAYVVADNQLVITGGWSRTKLRAMVARFRGKRGVGFTDKQYENLLDSYRSKERTVVETTARPATFWLTVKGPVPAMPDAIAKLRAALAAMPGIEVSGYVEGDDP